MKILIIADIVYLNGLLIDSVIPFFIVTVRNILHVDICILHLLNPVPVATHSVSRYPSLFHKHLHTYLSYKITILSVYPNFIYRSMYPNLPCHP